MAPQTIFVQLILCKFKNSADLRWKKILLGPAIDTISPSLGVGERRGGDGSQVGRLYRALGWLNDSGGNFPCSFIF